MAPSYFDATFSPYRNGASKVGTGTNSQEHGDFPASFFGEQRGPESGMAVPHVLSMQAIVGTAWRNYWHGAYDEALRNSVFNADAMRQDPFMRGLLDERKHGVCSLRASIEVDNERDPWQKALKDGLTQQWRSIWHSYDLNWYMLEAIWYGRYGGQFIWKKKVMDLPALPKAGGVAPGLPAILGAPGGRDKRECLVIQRHLPIEGDKIGYDYDGCPYILVAVQASTELTGRGAMVGPIPDIHAKSMEYGFTTAGGKALYLRSPSWRQRFAIHANEILDGPFNSAEKGDQVHGVGIRSCAYWYWWLRDEFLCNVTDWCARVGQGVRLWYYPSGNPAAEAAINKAAVDQSDKVNIKVPYEPGTELQQPVQFIDTSSTGSDLLLRIVQHVEEQIQVYVVGQSMSQGAQENNGSGFGDRGRADFARSTKWQITRRDAAKYGDTCTTDILDVMKKWSYPPEMQEIPARVVFHVDDPDPEKLLNAAKTFVGMGGTIREDEVRNPLGFSSPQEGDKVLGGQTPLPPGMGGGGVPVKEDGAVQGGDEPNGTPNGTPQPAIGTYTNGKMVPENGQSNGNGVQDWAKKQASRFEMGTREAARSRVHDVMVKERYDMVQPKQQPIIVNVSPPEITINNQVPEQRIPDVNVQAPTVNVFNRMPKQVPPDIHVAAPNVIVDVPKQDAPVINVESPTVNVAAPNVTVESPEIRPEIHNDIHVDVPKQEPPIVNVTQPTNKKVRLKKNSDGVWTGEVEQE